MTPWQTILAIDFDRHASATYAANFPDTEVRCASVADELDRLPDCDVILGGPPCQPHSHAGKRLASKDARDCGPDFAEAVRRKQPRMFLMENVPGLLTSEGGKYAQRLLRALEDAGYVVEVKVQDAVQFGVPQFRVRCWWWGIRADLYRDGIRHCWPAPTHQWPPPEPGGLFGDEYKLLPGVTVGQALGLDGWCETKQKRTIHLTSEPAYTVGHDDRRTIAVRRGRGAGVERRDHPFTEPCPTVPADTGGTGGLFVVQGVRYDHGVAVPGEPCPTLKAGGNYDTSGKQGGGCPPQLAINGTHAYRWSDAMLAKHPPASPASPAPTVQAKWFKGGAEGLLDVTGASWKRKGDLWVRRLTPLECLRLQSGPDDFRWPEKISKTAMYRVIGNGWACGHAAAFSRALAAADPDARTVVDLFAGGGLGAVGWHQRHWVYQQRKAGAA